MPIRPDLAERTFAAETVVVMSAALEEACKKPAIAFDNPSRAMVAMRSSRWSRKARPTLNTPPIRPLKRCADSRAKRRRPSQAGWHVTAVSKSHSRYGEMGRL